MKIQHFFGGGLFEDYMVIDLKYFDWQNKRREIILNENKRYIKDSRYIDFDVIIIQIFYCR